MTTLTILYKSGQKVRVRVKTFSVKRYADGRVEFSWDGINPKPLLLGADEIEAVWEGKV